MGISSSCIEVQHAAKCKPCARNKVLRMYPVYTGRKMAKRISEQNERIDELSRRITELRKYTSVLRNSINERHPDF